MGSFGAISFFGVLVFRLDHCEVAMTHRIKFFARVGLAWVMLRRVVNFLGSWNVLPGNAQIMAIWMMVPICLLRCLWRERNEIRFEDRDRSMDKFRTLFLGTLFQWSIIIVFNGFNGQV